MLPKLLFGSSSFPIVVVATTAAAAVAVADAVVVIINIIVLVVAQGAHSIEKEDVKKKHRIRRQRQTAAPSVQCTVYKHMHMQHSTQTHALSTFLWYHSLLSSSLHWFSRVVAVIAASHESHQISDTFLFPFVFSHQGTSPIRIIIRRYTHRMSSIVHHRRNKRQPPNSNSNTEKVSAL